MEFDSVQWGKMVLQVRSRPDVVLQRDDIYSIVPAKLIGVSEDHPKKVVWSATLWLTPGAVERVRSLANELQPNRQILISSGGNVLDVSYIGHVGRAMGIGEFSSRSELVDAFSGYAVVEEESGDVVEVFSREELARMGRLTEPLEHDERMLGEMEEIRRAAADGRISDEEMMERLEALKRNSIPH